MGRSVIMHALMSFMINAPYETPPTTTPTTPTTTYYSKRNITSQGCFEGYGCFPIDGPWAGPERPVSLYPLPPPELTPTFCLHTPARPSCHALDLQDSSTFNEFFLHLSTASSITLLTHGYLESTQLEWVERLLEALLSTGDSMGVVAVDWSRAAPPTYAQAVANIRLVGVMVGQLLVRLTDLGITPSAIHLVGHSLGAHLMSYAANHLETMKGRQVGRLTGLDPAGPYFANTASEVRLDPSDAAFVDVIHTDAPSQDWELNRLGYADALGHVDFYPNGGHHQAGCQGSAAAFIQRRENVAGGVLSYIGCSHQRSTEFFAESILNSKCQFQGVECTSWEHYKAGGCWGCDGGRCQAMGYPATRPGGEGGDRYAGEITAGLSGTSSSTSFPKKIFLGTDSASPFCVPRDSGIIVNISARGGGGGGERGWGREGGRGGR
ncbi:pancreatic lipase-related protein 2-like isoform X2 [Eriocheir sinensis]|uniref:pancreatic lipase-related protein 2-like isoform X2 n=1 Tax=Eriocheir sinensis TaxID=95602 RepID=UPI0021C8FCBB|nr:pancreatic lipase-related protein 2-like isoform X2 [Eriocheir sinensis]